MHYIPEHNTYVYFRSNEDKTVMVVINKNEKTYDLDLKRFSESLKSFKSGKDVISKNQYDLSVGKITLSPKASLVLELK